VTTPATGMPPPLASLLNERRDFDGAVQTVRAAAATADISDRNVVERLIGSPAGYGNWDGSRRRLTRSLSDDPSPLV
jgi:hypothetical protein